MRGVLIYSHFDYACSMWFSCVSSTSRKRLQIIQNKLIRFILSISTRNHTGYREFSSGNMLPVEYRVTLYCVGKVMDNLMTAVIS